MVIARVVMNVITNTIKSSYCILKWPLQLVTVMACKLLCAIGYKGNGAMLAILIVMTTATASVMADSHHKCTRKHNNECNQNL